MKRLDAHHHLWDVSRRAYPWMNGPWADPLRSAFTPRELAQVTAAHRVEATIVVQALSDTGETLELLETAARTELIAGVVGWVDLTAGDVEDGITALKDAPGGGKLVGIRHQAQDEPDPRWLLRDDVMRGLRAVAAAGLAYDLLVTARELPAAIEVTRRLPEVAFVLDHLGKPEIRGSMDPWSSRLTELAGQANVTAKLSGLVTEADWNLWTPGQLVPYICHAVDVFGPDRLMYGSDWPVCTLAASYDQVLEVTETALAGLSPAELTSVFAGTAGRVYRVDLPAR